MMASYVDINHSNSSSSEPQAAAAACILEVLLPETILQILKVLSRTPESIVAFSLSCSAAYQLCSDQALWTGLCRSITDSLPIQSRNHDWCPPAWGADSYKELYICLLQPYRHLLQQRVWHTTKMPAGQLLVIDVMKPLIVGRSVSFNTLQGSPISHGLFIVRLPHQHIGAVTPVKGKAKVYCCACPPSEHLPAEEIMVVNMARSGQYYGMCNAKHLAPAQLSFLRELPPAAAAAQGPADAGAAATSAEVPGVVADGGGASNSEGRLRSAAGCVAGLALCCTSHCGSLYAELVSRWRLGEPYTTATDSTAAVDGSAAAGTAASRERPQAHGTSGSNGGSSGSSSGSSLALPDVGEFSITPWDLRWIVEELDVPADWRSHAVYTPFNPSPWLQPTAATAAGLAGRADGVSGATSRSSRASELIPAPPPPPAAAGLTGLWRGTYGSHGVELVHLQLLQVPAGYNLLQQHGAPEGTIMSFRECPRAVLLQEVLHTPPPVIHPSLLQYVEGMTSFGAALIQQQQQQAGAGVADAQAVGDAGSSSSSSSHQDVSTDQQQQQQQQQQPRKLLLVAIKVTGDRNVPAGQVTFAVDLATRSTAGAGQLLLLPPGIHSDVKVNAPGTRQFIIKESFTGLAQIADVHFQSPRLIPVELLVFEDTDCLGLLWKAPMDSFSLLSKQQSVP